MDLRPNLRKDKETQIEKTKRYLSSNWVFSSLKEKFILMVMLLYATFSIAFKIVMFLWGVFK